MNTPRSLTNLSVAAALMAIPATAMAAIPVTTSQTEPFAFTQNSGVSLAWSAFDDQDGAMELQRVLLHVEGQIEASFRLTNHSDTAVDTDAYVAESLFLSCPTFGDNALAIIDVDTVVSCVAMLGPGETCDYGGTILFEGTLDLERSDEAALQSFLGTTPPEMHIDGFGQIDYDGDLYTWSIETHTVSGSATLIYEFRDAVTCSEDIGRDGRVDFDDLIAVLMAWGDCVGCQEDVDDNGVVDGSDLLQVMSSWGHCP